MKQLTLSFQAVLDMVKSRPTMSTGEIALNLGQSVEYTQSILHELRAMELVDCLYSERLEQFWYPVVNLERA